MPKVKASKSRVHHKAVGGRAAYAHPVIEAPTQTPSAESMQAMKEQFGLEFEDDRVDKKDKRKLRHDKWMSSKSFVIFSSEGETMSGHWHNGYHYPRTPMRRPLETDI